MRVRLLISLLAVLLIATTAQASLRAYWNFEEGSGDFAYDSSGNGNHGQLIADTEAGDPPAPLGATTQPNWVAGAVGGTALEFCAGTDNYNHVAIAKSDSLKDLGSTWTFAMWIRQDSRDLTPGGGSGYPRILSCPNYEIELGVPGWEYDYFWPYGTGAAQTDIGTSYIGAGGGTGQWYHMALTYDGTDLKKYLNGTLVPDSVKNIPGLTLNNIWDDTGWADAPLKLASQVWPNKDWFIGALDEVAIWGDEYLDAAAVQDVYLNGVPEPMTLVLLGLGGLVLRKRSR